MALGGSLRKCLVHNCILQAWTRMASRCVRASRTAQSAVSWLLTKRLLISDCGTKKASACTQQKNTIRFHLSFRAKPMRSGAEPTLYASGNILVFSRVDIVISEQDYWFLSRTSSVRAWSCHERRYTTTDLLFSEI